MAPARSSSDYGDRDQAALGKGAGDLALVIVIVVAVLEAARHGHHPAAFPERGDQRAGPAVADDDIGVAQDGAHRLNGRVS